MHIRPTGVKISKDKEEAIIRDYLANVQTIIINKRYGVSHKTVFNVLNRNNIPYRKFIVKFLNRRDDYFDQIDTEEKAYFLGLFAADGNIDGKYIIRISLKQDDSYILEKYSRILLGENNVKLDNRKDKTRNPQSTLCIGSKGMVDGLATHGVCERKSFDLDMDMSKLNDQLFRAFVLGLTDGDGSIFKLRNRNSFFYNYHLICSYPLSKQIRSRILTILGLTFSEEVIPSTVDPTKFIMSLRIKGQKELGRFLKWLYTNPIDCLIRKKTRYHEFLAYRKTRGLPSE